jgi:hypothetical protein
MASLEECLKQAAHRLDAAIKAELKNRNPQTKQVMEHTPTPWTDKTSAKIPAFGKLNICNFPFYVVSEVNWERAKICVNACAEFPDPKIDIGLLKLHAEQQTKLLASCETAIAERDKEIAILLSAVEELGEKAYKYDQLNK